MATPRIDRAKALAEYLNAHGVQTFIDPAEAAANLPCVLIAPPEIAFDRFGDPDGSAVWSLVILAAGAGLGAWQQLDETLAGLCVEATVERATPAQYPLGGATVPAYVVTYSD